MWVASQNLTATHPEAELSQKSIPSTITIFCLHKQHYFVCKSTIILLASTPSICTHVMETIMLHLLVPKQYFAPITHTSLCSIFLVPIPFYCLYHHCYFPCTNTIIWRVQTPLFCSYQQHYFDPPDTIILLALTPLFCSYQHHNFTCNDTIILFAMAPIYTIILLTPTYAPSYSSADNYFAHINTSIHPSFAQPTPLCRIILLKPTP